MFRWVSIAFACMLTLTANTKCWAQSESRTVSPAANQAKQKFEGLMQIWAEKTVALQEKSQARKSVGSGRKKADEEIDAMTAEVEGMIDQIVQAGLAVHKGGLTEDEIVNSTLTSIAGFYITGDSKGDGGDQYEKALPLIKTMLSSGLGSQSPQLWLWGGVAAFNVNEFSLAQQYFSKSETAGLLGDRPPGGSRGDPLNRVWQLARRQIQELPATRQAWQKEKAIRLQEAEVNDLPRVVLHTSRGNVTIELSKMKRRQLLLTF